MLVKMCLLLSKDFRFPPGLGTERPQKVSLLHNFLLRKKVFYLETFYYLFIPKKVALYCPKVLPLV